MKRQWWRVGVLLVAAVMLGGLAVDADPTDPLPVPRANRAHGR